MKPVSLVPLVLAASLALQGCTLLGSFFGSRPPDYKGAQARTTQPLEVPPELTAPTMDDRYAIPDPRAQTTYSAYSQRGAGASPAAAAGPAPVLPKFENVRMERSGEQRWLVVKGDADKVWPAVREFWVQSGYTFVREQPEIGIMETEWHEDRAKIPQDFVRRTIGRVLDQMWSTARRDKFRIRLEKGDEPGTTEIFISNRAVEEQFTSAAQDTTKWVPIAPDKDLEAEMLARLQAKLGASDVRVASAKPAQAAARGTATAVSAAPESRNAVLQNAGAGPLVVNDGFDRAWRRVGLALDRVGFTVEDRDRSKGLFFVRYIDPEADAATVAPKKEGFLDKLAFWRSAPKASSQPQYRIHVTDAGASMSHVQVQNAQGAAESSSTGRKILALLFDQLK